MKNNKSVKILPFVWLFLAVAAVFPFLRANAGIREDIEARNKQIEEIQRQIEEYQRQIETTGDKAKTLAGEISKLNSQISQIQLEIKSLGLAIDQTRAEIGLTNEQIEIAKKDIETHKEALASYIKILDRTDHENLTAVLFKNTRLSSFFDNLKNLRDTQNRAKSAVIAIKALQADLEDKQLVLEDKQDELEKLKAFQEAEKRNLSTNKTTKDKLLKETKGQEAKFQQLVKQSKDEIQKIKDQIFYLEQNGVTVEDAIKFGELAAIRTNIRPAFLIAILEVESGLGKNVGTGNWLDDMYKCYLRLGKPSRAETEKTAFLSIVGELGLNPDTVKVSREPNYGCGGALGPAQFLPSTWLGYKDEVARLTGHNPPNPWNIEDAFMASAVKLSRAGATGQTKKAETAAAKAYISGNASCTKTICNYYANAVLNKAAIIEQNL